MIEGVLGESLVLGLGLSDGAVDKFPRAEVYDGAGALVATVDLVHAANGMYRAAYAPAAAGRFSVHLRVYSDAPRTTIAGQYERVLEDLTVRAISQDVAFAKILGHLGENVRDDVLTYDANKRPLTFRRRIFASKGDAIASTPGGTGEGEIVTVLGSSSHFDSARWESLLRTLE